MSVSPQLFAHQLLRRVATVPGDEVGFHKPFDRDCDCGPEVGPSEQVGWLQFTHKSLESIWSSDSTIAGLEADVLLERALAEIEKLGNRPVRIETDMTLLIGVIGYLQFALRNVDDDLGSRRKMFDFVRALIQTVDPERGDVYRFLTLGFNK